MSIAFQQVEACAVATVLKQPILDDPGLGLPLHRFTVAQYHRMIEAGILTENDRVELLDGLVVAKTTHNPSHDVAVDLLNTALAHLLPEEWRVRVQSAVTLPQAEPEPDLAVVRGPARRYANSHPRPRDISLLVEVADTSLSEDRHFKAELYARSRIPIYWVVNLPGSRIEVFTRPRAGRLPAYLEREEYGPTDTIPLFIAGAEVGQIAVRDVLP